MSDISGGVGHAAAVELGLHRLWSALDAPEVTRRLSMSSVLFPERCRRVSQG